MAVPLLRLTVFEILRTHPFFGRGIINIIPVRTIEEREGGNYSWLVTISVDAREAPGTYPAYFVDLRRLFC